MEYMFMIRKDKEILRTKSKENTSLSGYQFIRQENKDDSFFIVKLIHEDKDSAGNFYKWYEIRNHATALKNFAWMEKRINQLEAMVDYLAMQMDIKELNVEV